MMTRALLLLFGLAVASCSIDPVETNERADALSTSKSVDHSAWHQLLQRFVSADGVVDYPAWHGDAAARASLEAYIAGFAAVDVAGLASDAERMAFWINAYNAITVHGMLRFWPTESIRDHSGFWDQIKTWCGTRHVSLNDIEHEILRKMGDPRIHVAINCASVSCPVLLDAAYTAADLDQQLHVQSARFVADGARNQIDDRAEVARLSRIFDWFGADFDVEPYGGVRGFVRRYVNPKREWMGGEFAIEFLDYDWRVNGPSNAPGPAGK